MPTFLLIRRSKQGARATLATDFEAACEAGRVFVGTHNKVDGCSTERHEEMRRTFYGPKFSCSRSSSFGHKSATVTPVGLDFETDIA